MERYKVILEKIAENDLADILDYIGLTLHETRTAERIYKSIKEQVKSLSEMPFRYPVIREEPYRTIGVRRMLVENYSIFYVADSENKSVHVFRVLYSRREWEKLL